MNIKVCGITSLEQMQQLQELGIDYTGLIFFEGSQRFIGDALANHLAEVRGLKIQRVGVFVSLVNDISSYPSSA